MEYATPGSQYRCIKKSFYLSLLGGRSLVFSHIYQLDWQAVWPLAPLHLAPLYFII